MMVMHHFLKEYDGNIYDNALALTSRLMAWTLCIVTRVHGILYGQRLPKCSATTVSVKAENIARAGTLAAV